MIRTRPNLAGGRLLFAPAVSAQRGTPPHQQVALPPYRASAVYDVGGTFERTAAPGAVTIQRHRFLVRKEGKVVSEAYAHLNCEMPAPPPAGDVGQGGAGLLAQLLDGGEFKPKNGGR